MEASDSDVCRGAAGLAETVVEPALKFWMGKANTTSGYWANEFQQRAATHYGEVLSRAHALTSSIVNLLYLEINVLARHFKKAFLRNIENPN